MDELYALCRQYGSFLNLPPGCGIDGARFMLSIGGCESSFGKNLAPRYEKSYDVGGENYRNEQIELIAFYAGRKIYDANGVEIPLEHNPAAYSWGPFQMMICDAIGFTIQELASDPEKCALAFVGFFNRFIIGVRHALTFAEMAQTYNSGHFVNTPEAGVARYVADAQHYYQSIELAPCSA